MSKRFFFNISNKDYSLFFLLLSFSRKYVEESRDFLLKNEQTQDQKEITMLQQFLIKHKNSNLSFETVVSLMSEFLLASFDTVREQKIRILSFN